MFESKFFTVMAAVSFAVLAVAVVFQVLEMNDYSLFETLQARFF